MSPSLRGGTVLITGASRGIGRSTALALAGAGHDLVLWARSSPELEQTAALCRELGVAVRTAQVNVADADSVLGSGCESLPDQLRGLVLNAGIGIWGSLSELSPAEWRSIVGTNLDGAFYTLRAALPALRRHPFAQIVALGSDSSSFAFPSRAGYCASKAGLSGLVETLRREVRGEGMRVTELVPSRVDTFFRGKEPGTRPSALASEDIASLIVYVFGLPWKVELRELHVASLQSSFGPFEERAEQAPQEE
jgi:NADP-dependent 3-hydroxy acid dehydrogenase YdfG